MTPSRQNNFDFIRMLAALFVLFSHQHALTGLDEPLILDTASLGGFGVLIFFSISGFLVTQSWEADPSAWRFIAKRLLRIWPGLSIVVILVAVVLGPLVSTKTLGEYYSDPLFWDYFHNLRFSVRDSLPLRFSGNAKQDWINGSLWTIPLEIKCYIALGALAISGVLRVRLMLPLLSILAAATYFCLEPRFTELSASFKWVTEKSYLIQLVLFFFSGASLCKLEVHKNPRIALIAMTLCFSMGALLITIQKPLLALWLVVPLTTIIIGNASTPGLRSFGHYGDLSFGMYLYAFPVQQTIIWLYYDRYSWGTVLGISIVTTAAFAFLSWHLVEKWALRLKPVPKHGGNKFLLG